MTAYVKQRMFERLISELEQSLEHMTDNDLERIIFLCWAEQQSRSCSSQQSRREKGDDE